MFGNTYRLGAVRGVDIEVDTSWVIIALLVAWTFWSRFSAVHGHAVPLALTMAVAATVLFFGSVLAHELAHSLEAIHRGVRVDGITLFLFGGVTRTRFDVERPRDEFALTAVGPFTSLVLAATLGLAATYADRIGLGPVADVAGNLAWINLALALFNLLPGAPLDGGRILRSMVWAVTDDRGLAIRVASRSGQVLGALIGALGLFQLFFVPGGAGGGIWFAFIGWFLLMAATGELRQREQLERSERAGAPGRIGTHLQHVDDLPQATPETEVREALRRLGDHDLVIVRDDGEIVGVVSRRELERAAEEDARPTDGHLPDGPG